MRRLERRLNTVGVGHGLACSHRMCHVFDQNPILLHPFAIDEHRTGKGNLKFSQRSRTCTTLRGMRRCSRGNFQYFGLLDVQDSNNALGFTSIIDVPTSILTTAYRPSEPAFFTCGVPWRARGFIGDSAEEAERKLLLQHEVWIKISHRRPSSS